MCGCNIVEWMGGTSRFITSLTFFIHFIHPLFCIINYCAWVCYQESVLGKPILDAYLALSIVAAFFYLFVASVFYMWAWRFPEPEEVSKRRRIYGVVVNVLFSDIPLFAVEVKICWEVQFANGIQGASFIITCISLSYSAIRVWTFIMIKLIKVRAPVIGVHPQFAGSMTHPSIPPNSGPQGLNYYGNNVPHEKLSSSSSGFDYRNMNPKILPERYAPSERYRYDVQYTDGRYAGEQYSTPGRHSWPNY